MAICFWAGVDRLRHLVSHHLRNEKLYVSSNILGIHWYLACIV